MLLKIYPENPNIRHIKTIVECLNDGGIIIYPTDTIYALGCNMSKSKALERIIQIKGIKKKITNLSFICNDLSQLSDYTKPISNPVYKLMRKTLPGPFTFILEANNKVSKLIKTKKKTVGIRIPDNNIVYEIIKELGNPILSTSIHDENKIIEYPTNPELIYEKYKNIVDIIIDGGFGGNIPSTIIDCTTEECIILRQGKGVL